MDDATFQIVLKDGCRTVPLLDAGGEVIRVAVVTDPDGSAVRLRSSPIAEVFAGVIEDASGSILDLVEIQVRAEGLVHDDIGTIETRWHGLRDWMRTAGVLVSGPWEAGESLVGGDGVRLSPEPVAVLVRRATSTSFDAFVDWLSSDQMHRPPHDRFGDAVRLVRTRQDVYSSVDGISGREAEAFYLKVRIIREAIASVRDAVRVLDRPLLSVRPSALSVRLGDSGDLGMGWIARVEVDDPGRVVEVPTGQGEPRRFAAQGLTSSVYAPAELNIEQETMSRLRLTNVLTSGTGDLVVEGVLTPNEPVRIGTTTMVSLRLPIGSDRFLIRGVLNRDGSVGAGSVGFVSTPDGALASRIEALRQMQGAEFAEVATSMVAASSTPSDLHALGVVGIRTLLSSTGEDLGLAIDALHTIAADLGASTDDPVTRLVTKVSSDDRLARVLGPARSGRGSMSTIPPRLWWRTIALLAKFFPGVSSWSFESDLTLARHRPLDSVFEAPLEEVDGVVRLARGLVVSDAPTVREIGAMIDRALST
ncbi:MAG: hypothetical protein KDA28_11860 [Phycisphaerales bacterium]|nr:hypothetical protein [Phycisphaerales bacterium]